MKKNFAIIGCAGYIAPKHLEAIKNTGNKFNSYTKSKKTL